MVQPVTATPITATVAAISANNGNAPDMPQLPEWEKTSREDDQRNRVPRKEPANRMTAQQDGQRASRIGTTRGAVGAKSQNIGRYRQIRGVARDDIPGEMERGLGDIADRLAGLYGHGCERRQSKTASIAF